MKQKFKHTCPKCRAKDKVVIKCPTCWKYTCFECSINGVCIDCYTLQREKQEIKSYFEDKNSEVLPDAM